ncbi:MAG: ABC transporter permease, partial [Nocardiopsaceae bacterium]|nr:ABC transporter permease [Nocardiopsaceae bacterium]
MLGRRRALAFALPAVILIALTLVLRASRPAGVPWPDHVLGDFGFSVLLPLTALIVGTGVLGAEIDEGSAIHLLATPVRRSEVVLTKFAVAAGMTALFAAVPELIAGLIAPDSGKLAWALFIGALVGSVAYSAVFVMASVLTTRAIAVGLLYVLVWEGLLANLVGGVRILSIAHYSLGVANAIDPDPNLHAGLTLTTSVIMAAVVTAGALVFASRRLASFAIKGEPVLSRTDRGASPSPTACPGVRQPLAPASKCRCYGSDRS